VIILFLWDGSEPKKYICQQRSDDVLTFMINTKTIKRITWADFAVPAIVCMIGTRFVYIFSICVPIKWAAIRSGYVTLGNFTITRKFAHFIYTCVNTQLLMSTFLIWILAILTYIIIRRKFHNHIIRTRVVYLICWFLVLLLIICCIADYITSLMISNY